MNKNFLFIVSSHGELGSSGNKTGSWMEELAAPYWRFRDAGYAVTIASPKGGAAPIDPMSVEDNWLSDAGRRFRADPMANAAIADTVSLDTVDGDAFAGVFMVGASATTWDFPHNPALKGIIEGYFAQGKVIAAVCHGVIALVQAVDANGEPLVKNRQLTSISNAEDVMMGLDKIVPVLPEEMLRKLRAIYSAAAPLAAHVVTDPPFFTGQNPASADPLALAILAHLERAAAV
ncbi:type 1 glutamine amidotransferase domain-containing protein [Flavisphingomonas formosensis]|uniref:type 1 glutamine amidotransferase domain-containing protein n=1 Tax=Flavisphingomonas formosensis TaxID=861534 RepID=UPI0012F9B5CC|nr:type 1 glutamine amidotransferase domain-containing protein [Sphingomonas formosensis]